MAAAARAAAGGGTACEQRGERPAAQRGEIGLLGGSSVPQERRRRDGAELRWTGEVDGVMNRNKGKRELVVLYDTY